MEGILGMEQPVEFTMGSLLDPTMALLLIGAYKNYADFAYRDYKDFVDQLKEFNKENRDFYSRIGMDNLGFLNASRGAVQKAYQDLIDQGIDPLRTFEGRAALARAMLNVDYYALSQMRASAKTADEYSSNVADLLRNGLYNKDFAEFEIRQSNIDRFGKEAGEAAPTSLSNWDTSKYGVWNIASPTKYLDTHDIAYGWAKEVQPVQTLGKKYDVTLVSRDMIKDSVKGHIDPFMSTTRGQYEAEVLNRERKARGEAPLSGKALRDAMVERMTDAGKEAITVKYNMNEDYKMLAGFAHDASMENLRARNNDNHARLLAKLNERGARLQARLKKQTSDEAKNSIVDIWDAGLWAASGNLGRAEKSKTTDWVGLAYKAAKDAAKTSTDKILGKSGSVGNTRYRMMVSEPQAKTMFGEAKPFAITGAISREQLENRLPKNGHRVWNDTAYTSTKEVRTAFADENTSVTYTGIVTVPTVYDGTMQMEQYVEVTGVNTDGTRTTGYVPLMRGDSTPMKKRTDAIPRTISGNKNNTSYYMASAPLNAGNIVD